MNEPSTPSITIVAIAAELACGLLGGLCAAALLAVGGSYLFSALVPDLGMGLLIIQLFLGALGFALGVAVGVSLAGRWQRQGGSWWLGLGGSVLGGVIVLALAQTSLFGTFTGLALALAIVVPLGLAVLGYNLRRRPPAAEPDGTGAA